MADELVEMIRNFHLSEEEEEVIPIDDEICKQVVEACSFSLAGKVITTKKFNVAVMKESLRRAWGSLENLTIAEVGDNLFHFRFANENSLCKVLNGGPWNFNNHLLALQAWEPGMKVEQVPFSSINFWIQLWGLPFEFVNPKIGEIIGKKIGSFCSVDERAAVGDKGRFIRVRVGIAMDKPLKHGGFIALGNGSKFWVDYKFERLNSFCFYCGNLLHEQGECGVKISNVENGVVKEGKFGPWMKAIGGGIVSGMSQSDSRWIVDGLVEEFFHSPNSCFGPAKGGNFKILGDKEGELISDFGIKTGLTEFQDSARITINGKESLIPSSDKFPNKAKALAFAPNLDDMKMDASTGLCKGVSGLGPAFQQSPIFQKGLHQPFEASLMGLNNSFC